MLNVKDYIRNEIEFIEKYEKDKEYAKKDIKYLKSLNDKDIEIIEDRVLNDDELQQYINETINYYLYHYSKRLESEIE